MANTRVINDFLSDIIAHQMLLLLSNVQIEIVKCKHEPLRNFLSQTMNAASVLLGGFHPKSATNSLDQLDQLTQKILDGWIKLYSWHDINYYKEKAALKNPEKKIVDDCIELLKLLQNLARFAIRFADAMERLNEEAEKKVQISSLKLKEKLTSCRLTYNQLKLEIEHEELQCKLNIDQLAEKNIAEKLSAYLPRNVYLTKLNFLQKLREFFYQVINEKKVTWPDFVRHYFKAFADFQSELDRQAADLKQKKAIIIKNFKNNDYNVKLSLKKSCLQYSRLLEEYVNFYEENFDEFQEEYELHIKPFIDSLQVQIQPILQKIAAISADVVFSDDEHLNDYLRGIQNDSSVKIIFSNFSLICNRKIDLLENFQQNIIAAVSESTGEMQLFKKQLDDIFSQIQEQANPKIFAMFSSVLADIEKQSLVNWHEKIKQMNVIVNQLLADMEASQLTRERVANFTAALRSELLKMAKEKFTIFMTTLSGNNGDFSNLLEENKLRSAQEINDNLKSLQITSQSKAEQLQEIEELKDFSLQGKNFTLAEMMSCLEQEANNDKKMNDGSIKSLVLKFIKKLFTQHWKAMLLIGLITALLASVIVASGLFAPVIGVAVGASFFSNLTSFTFALGAVISPTMAHTVGTCMISMGAGILVALKVGIILTALDNDPMPDEITEIKPEPAKDRSHISSYVAMKTGLQNPSNKKSVSVELRSDKPHNISDFKKIPGRMLNLFNPAIKIKGINLVQVKNKLMMR